MIDWSPLRAELKHWRREDLTLPLWWRDDDAATATVQLEQLQEMSQAFGIPVHLAVIPSDADKTLQPLLASGTFRAVVHGWAHENHARQGEKKAEFQSSNPNAILDAQRGLEHLSGLFGDHLHPMFVPPWNRVSADVVQNLPGVGYKAISTYQPRRPKEPVTGLLQINTHIDPIDWHGTRSLVDPAELIILTVGNLQDRRLGQSDGTEPLGLLTHHLVHDEVIWDFCKGLLNELLEIQTSLFDMAELQKH